MKLFENRKPRTNEECIGYLKRKNGIMCLMAVIGILTIVFAIWLKFTTKLLEINENGTLYMGFGCGLCAVAIFNIIKNRKIAKDQQRLKAYRVMLTDEREEMILGKAYRMSTFVVLIISYVAALIGSMWMPYLMYVLAVQVIIMVIAYLVFYKIYSRQN